MLRRANAVVALSLLLKLQIGRVVSTVCATPGILCLDVETHVRPAHAWLLQTLREQSNLATAEGGAPPPAHPPTRPPAC